MVIPFLDLKSFLFSNLAGKLIPGKSGQRLILMWPFDDPNAAADDVVTSFRPRRLDLSLAEQYRHGGADRA
jgi:hypothetical protein